MEKRASSAPSATNDYSETLDTKQGTYADLEDLTPTTTEAPRSTAAAATPFEYRETTMPTVVTTTSRSSNGESTVVVITSTQTDSGTATGSISARSTRTNSPTLSIPDITSAQPNKSSGGLSAGASAGIGVGVALGVLLLVGLAFFLYRRRRNRRSQLELPELGTEGQKQERGVEDDTRVELSVDGQKHELAADSPRDMTGSGGKGSNLHELE